jgi:hypothetical protein
MSRPTPFAYPAVGHMRRHASAGYKDYRDFKPWLRDEFEFRCVYCLQREMWSRVRDAVREPRRSCSWSSQMTR